MMSRDIDALIGAAINTCWRERMTVPTLLTVLIQQQPPGSWVGPVTQLFTDVPVSALQRFAACHALSVALLGQYYDRFVRPLGDVNDELERWIYDSQKGDRQQEAGIAGVCGECFP